MAGHSKWANIKRRKGAQDAQRGKVFTRLIRELATAARLGGADPDGNARLRLAIEKARAANMPKDTMTRAISRGSGGGEGEAYEEVMYEGYGPGGAAVLIEGLTDNRNRTAGEVRRVFNQLGGKLGAAGCVAYMFEKKGLLVFEDVADAAAAGAGADALLEAALEAGAEDLREGEPPVVVTAPAQLESARAALARAGFTATHAELSMEAANDAPLSASDAEKMLQLLSALEELDDVQAVHTNAGLPEVAPDCQA